MGDKKNVYVIGHKNPDTDSICAAISYAYLKNEIAARDGLDYFYIPARNGHVNEETQFVLKHFDVPQPLYLTDIRPQVLDIENQKNRRNFCGFIAEKSMGYHAYIKNSFFADSR